MDSEEPLPTITPELEVVPTIAPDQKVSRKEAGYRVLGTPGSFCEDCQHWTGAYKENGATGGCSIVSGDLFVRGSCSLFEPKKK